MSRVSRQWTAADRAEYVALPGLIREAEAAGRAAPGLRLRRDRLTGQYVRHLRATLGPRKAFRRSF